MVDLSAVPFTLDAAGTRWVMETLDAMDVDERIGQLFCLELQHDAVDDLVARLDRLGLHPGGFLSRPASASIVRGTLVRLQADAAVPLLIAGNLETGGEGIVAGGTRFASQMLVAATPDDMAAYHLGRVCGREAAAVGVNWAFAPVVDLDFNPDNPVTNARTFGSNPDLVAGRALAYLRGLREHRIAGTAKHWPGDGVDGRDQHLVTSVNSLDVDSWEGSYGRVYRTLIDAGVETVMAAHILLPAYSRLLRPGIGDAEIMPGSLAAELLGDLLRARLGFNGLIVSDSTKMTGMTAAMARRAALPAAVAAGCDMLLCTIDLEADVAAVREGVRDGRISRRRLDDAVTRVLALKASLGLHEVRTSADAVPPMEPSEVDAWGREAAGQGVTLVKDTQKLLPLDPTRHRRVQLHVLGDQGGLYDGTQNIAERFEAGLAERGFLVDRFDPRDESLVAPEALASRFDLIVYIAYVRPGSHESTSRIAWQLPQGRDAPKYPNEVPMVFVSFWNPYHLRDVPMIRTCVNAYFPAPHVVDAVIDRLVGAARFEGTSPVDPFCGLWDAQR